MTGFESAIAERLFRDGWDLDDELREIVIAAADAAATVYEEKIFDLVDAMFKVIVQ